ncbi:MAG: hypothetical protein M0C28_34750 [Candidatus Moduliflexus flocculans]|nr:hypothetical protein [Candidatus Moduliflexus flocculans]
MSTSRCIRATYKERRDVMLEMMEEMFPAEVIVDTTAGRHVPVGHPARRHGCGGCAQTRHRDARWLSCRAQAFHPNGGGKNTMRINFSYSAPDTIREGMTRLGTTLKELISRIA